MPPVYRSPRESGTAWPALFRRRETGARAQIALGIDRFAVDADS